MMNLSTSPIPRRWTAIRSSASSRRPRKRRSSSSITRKESWKLFAASSAELNNELNARAWNDTLPRFALRPAAMDAGRYARFEKFLKDAGLIKSIKPVSDIAIDVTAQ